MNVGFIHNCSALLEKGQMRINKISFTEGRLASPVSVSQDVGGHSFSSLSGSDFSLFGLFVKHLQ